MRACSRHGDLAQNGRDHVFGRLLFRLGLVDLCGSLHAVDAVGEFLALGPEFLVLRHRVIVSYEAEAEEITSEDLIEKILSEIPVP